MLDRAIDMLTELLGDAPGPAHFLNGAVRGSYFRPPVARSPVKSGLTGSPRKTPRAVAVEGVNGGADDAEGQDASPLSYRSGNTTVGNRQSEPAEFSDSDIDSQVDGGDIAFEQGPEPEQEEEEVQVANGFKHVDDNGDDHGDAADSPKEQQEEEQEAPSVLPAKGRRGKKNDKKDEDGPGRGRKRGGQLAAGSRTKDSNARPTKRAKTTTTPLDPEVDKAVQDYANRTGPLKGRSLYILKRETPTEGSAVQTRSGRRSVRPLAYWRNERCVYGNEEAAEGQRFPLTTIKEVIRSEELPSEKSHRGKRKGRSKGKNKGNDSDDEDDKYLDPWEKEGGVLHGYIRRWDSEAQTGIDEEEILGK